MNWSDPIQVLCANWQAFEQAEFAKLCEALWDEDFDVAGAYSLLPVERQTPTVEELEMLYAVRGVKFEDWVRL